MVEYTAEVVPHQPWQEDGTARVTPQPPYPRLETVELPLEHRPGGPVTVERSQYRSGIVIIPTDTLPSGDSAVLPMKATSEDSITMENGEHQEWPNGIVVLFTA